MSHFHAALKKLGGVLLHVLNHYSVLLVLYSDDDVAVLGAHGIQGQVDYPGKVEI